MTTKIEITKSTEVKVTKEEPAKIIQKESTVELPDTIIIKKGQIDNRVTFRCAHCGTVFSTTNWFRTRGKHHSAKCPCCPYQAWAR